jgi:hypothetical protein
MGKSSGRGGFGRRGSGTVTVIETRVHRSSIRNARVGFIVTAFVVAVLTMTIAADRMHPILALMLGMLLGTACGAVVWALIRVWPVIRLIWWWSPEILIALAIVYGWTALAHHTALPLRLLIVTVVVGVPAAVLPINRRIRALAWCLIVRHRLRTCFSQFIIANRTGSLPLILLAKPTPIGERVWVYLRPGLAMADLETRLDKIAVACHATSVMVDRAGSSAAFLRLDIKRREVLGDAVDSPLVDLVDQDHIDRLPADSDTTITLPGNGSEVPTALDLPDVKLHPVKPTAPRTEPVKPRLTGVPSPAPVVTGPSGEDITDYI